MFVGIDCFTDLYSIFLSLGIRERHQTTAQPLYKRSFVRS
jgi:hypothetical protein